MSRRCLECPHRTVRPLRRAPCRRAVAYLFAISGGHLCRTRSGETSQLELCCLRCLTMFLGNHSLTPSIFPVGLSQRFQKGLADRGGWRKEIPPFSAPFSLCPLMSTRTQFWGRIFAVFWVLLVANPLPPTPFRNLGLRHTN